MPSVNPSAVALAIEMPFTQSLPVPFAPVPGVRSSSTQYHVAADIDAGTYVDPEGTFKPQL